MVICSDFRGTGLHYDLTFLSVIMKKALILIVLLLIVSPQVEGQCAMCRAVLESGENQEIGKGVNTGIKYLMIFPYLLIGGLGIYIYRKYRHS